MAELTIESIRQYLSQTCGSCKHFAQGKTCSYCDNPIITGPNREYCYYAFHCSDVNRYEKGIHQSRVDWMVKQEK